MLTQKSIIMLPFLICSVLYTPKRWKISNYRLLRWQIEYSVHPDYSSPQKIDKLFLSLQSLSYRGSTSWFSHHYFIFILARFHNVMWSCIKSSQLNNYHQRLQTLVAWIGIIVTLMVESSESEAFHPKRHKRLSKPRYLERMVIHPQPVLFK